jgi:hypothetical protein
MNFPRVFPTFVIKVKEKLREFQNRVLRVIGHKREE